MGKLWTFGDSFTESFNEKYGWSRSYIEWKKYKPKVYGEIISENLELELMNYGKNGSDNYSIFQTFCDVSDKIESGDVVIFGWSSPLRFRLVKPNNIWENLVPNFNKNHGAIEDVSSSCIDEIITHRTHKNFINEVNSWIKLITIFLNKINVNVIHWTPFEPTMSARYIINLEKIKFETKSELDDLHFSEKGQNDLANILITIIKNDKKKLI